MIFMTSKQKTKANQNSFSTPFVYGRKNPLESRLHKELGFEEGIKEIVRRVRELGEERPIFIAVYGFPNSGKTYLFEKLGEKLERLGLEPVGFSGAADASAFEAIKRNEYTFYGIEGKVTGKKPTRRVYLFHCAWNIMLKDHDPLDPNFLAREILGKEIHMNIGIYNPDRPEFLRKFYGDFDFVISNPYWVVKNVRACL